MAKTYADLTQQILQLQAQAEARRLSEAKGVIRTINEFIATYGLTAADLKFAQTSSPASAPEVRSVVAPKSAGSVAVKSGSQSYSDGAGNTWTGRGPRPKWLREALAAGDSFSKYEVTSRSKVKVAAKSIPAKKAAPASVSAKKAVPAKELAPVSVPAKKDATAVKAASKKAAVTSTSAKKTASASAKGAKAKRTPAKAASALQAATAQTHVPVAAGTIVDDGAAIATLTTDLATVELAPVQPQ